MAKRRYAIVNYNMYGSFTNYGSALHTYALQRVINEQFGEDVEAIVLNYCPKVLEDVNPLMPQRKMWDQDEESKKMLRLSMPVIKINYKKFQDFFGKYYEISSQKYIDSNFQDSLKQENLNGYICGSDTIWCIREFDGFDDGYFANYEVMKNSHTISYAASFGDVDFTNDELKILKNKLQNFKAISVRENINIDFIKENVSVPVQRVLDPTLLLKGEEYQEITEGRLIDEPYILLYARRYNKEMEQYADELAQELKCKVVEISLRAVNSEKHIMYYEAGVEEFLSLVKYAEHVVTNSFHGAIFGVQMHVPISVFSREQADSKIDELLRLLEIEDCKFSSAEERRQVDIDFEKVEEILLRERELSIQYLKNSL